MKEDTFTKLVKLYWVGKYTHAEIAEKVGVTYACVQYFFKTWKDIFSFPKPPKKFRKRSPHWKSTIMENVQEAYAFYLQGSTLQEIGNAYGGISRERVRQVFKMNGLKSRPTGRPSRKYLECPKGHKLGKGEHRNKCNICRTERKELRAKGLHRIKTCKQGHECTEENTYFYMYKGYKGRRCKKCSYGYIKKWKAKKNANISTVS